MTSNENTANPPLTTAGSRLGVRMHWKAESITRIFVTLKPSTWKDSLRPERFACCISKIYPKVCWHMKIHHIQTLALLPRLVFTLKEFHSKFTPSTPTSSNLISCLISHFHSFSTTLIGNITPYTISTPSPLISLATLFSNLISLLVFTPLSTNFTVILHIIWYVNHREPSLIDKFRVVGCGWQVYWW